MFERLDQAVRRALPRGGGSAGRTPARIYRPTPRKSFSAALLEEYGRRCPEVTVHLEERTPERVSEMVAKGRLDAGLTRPVLAHAALQMQTMKLRDERLCAAVPRHHAWAGKKSLAWKDLAGHTLIILARREGAELHDEILAACRLASFTPKFGHTPSLIGTVLRYVESGAGIGVVPESMGEMERTQRWVQIRLAPESSVPLVLVWKDQREEPPMTARMSWWESGSRAGSFGGRGGRTSQGWRDGEMGGGGGVGTQAVQNEKCKVQSAK